MAGAEGALRSAARPRGRGRADAARSRARAATPSSRRRCARTLIAALADIDEQRARRARRSWSSATIAPRATSRRDLRAWLAPRRVRYYPSRGVAYESHLAPPPHLVGLRVAALDALLGAGERRPQARRTADAPVVVVSAVALSEKVPDPELRPHSFTLRVGELLDLDECAAELVAAGYERVEQVEERGQFALRGGLLDVFPATEERAVRVDMFDVEIESLRWFSTFTQRSLGRGRGGRDRARRPSSPSEHRELAEIAAATGAFAAAGEGGRAPRHRRAAAASSASARCSTCSASGAERSCRRRGGARAGARRPLERRLRRLRRRGRPPPVREPRARSARHARRRARGSGSRRISGGQQIELRAQAADTAARSLAEAEPELEKLVRSGYRTVVAFPRRGEGERAAYNLGRLKASWLGRGRRTSARQALEPSLRFAAASLREGFIAPAAEARGVPRAPPAAPPPRRAAASGGPRRRGRRGALRSFTRPAHGRHRRPRGPRRRALRRLRDAHRRGRHARLPVPRIPGRRPRLRPHRPAREDLPLRRRRRRRIRR